MRRDLVELHSAELGADGRLFAYGHYGRPVLAFPQAAGSGADFEDRGVVRELSGLIDQGRIKLYCVDPHDAPRFGPVPATDDGRAERHAAWVHWVLDAVVPWIHDDCRGALDVFTAGVDLGALHAANFVLRRADLFPVGVCVDGLYDGQVLGAPAYPNSPPAFLESVSPGHLEWLRTRVSLILVCGDGPGGGDRRESTRRLASDLEAAGIKVELDERRGAADYSSWRRALHDHLARIC